MSDLSSIHDVVEGVLQAHGFEPAAATNRPYSGQSRDEWDHIVGPEDEFTPEPTGQCQGCDEWLHEDELRRWAGERRCADCCWLCPVCRDVEVLDENEFCNTCALWSMGAYEASPYLPKTAVCRFCERPIVQWTANPTASYVHIDDHTFCCGAEMDIRIPEPAPGTVVDPNQKAVR